MFKLIAGLANPGRQYDNTRHNIGAAVLDELKKILPTIDCASKFDAEICEHHNDGEKVYLFKSKTFMNESGQPLGDFARFYKIKPEEVLVIYDDVDLPVGHLRLSEGGSSGHQGVLSIMDHLGEDFWRLRIGIGDNRAVGLKSEDYVLQKFKPEETRFIQTAIERSVEVIKLLLENNTDKAKKVIEEVNKFQKFRQIGGTMEFPLPK